MIRTSRLLIAAALLCVLFAPAPAEAASAVMCRGAASGASAGPARWTAASGTTYTIDAMGCAVIGAADISDASANGFSQSTGLRALVKTGITAQDFTSLVVPAQAYVHQIVVRNTTANAVTGGVKVGTTAGGVDVVAALTCGANCFTFVADAALLKRVFSVTAPTPLSIDAVTSFNSASLDVTVLYSYF